MENSEDLNENNCEQSKFYSETGSLDIVVQEQTTESLDEFKSNIENEDELKSNVIENEDELKSNVIENEDEFMGNLIKNGDELHEKINEIENDDANAGEDDSLKSEKNHILAAINSNECNINFHNSCFKVHKFSLIFCHTGNVMHWNSVKKNTQYNSTQELYSCLRHLVRCWRKQYDEDNPPDLQKIYKNRLIIECPEHIDIPKEIEVPDLRLTVKVYLKTTNPENIRTAVLKTLEFARMEYIETLIIAFPPDELERDLITGDKIRRIWSMLEILLWDNKILRLGVSDFSCEQLQKLASLVHLQPQINQVNLAFSCAMPSELNAYAKERGIQLHTHNDMCEILTNENFKKIIGEEFCRECGNCDWKLPWVVRYLITAKSRAIVRSKGYVVGAELAKMN